MIHLTRTALAFAMSVGVIAPAFAGDNPTRWLAYDDPWTNQHVWKQTSDPADSQLLMSNATRVPKGTMVYVAENGDVYLVPNKKGSDGKYMSDHLK